ncbi:hypothetical protein IQ268_09260 [Oculatella sp. LEGE 06141]|uniref:hypothetical protein n=1 Tax=Oculatella sp. LEGE 06141 TaxID=1828648 RepID=UPI0018823142|nr:hypothetical protein [Oculatella sp. LEGE 06141]MBE9178747.1 hypothetical protein [Oculatella sp. LEGE 06141]
MAKGFGKPQPSDDDGIWVESMVASRALTPAVSIRWGKQQANLDPEEARHHAHAVLEAIAAAELDACLMQWAIQKLGLEIQEAGQILILFRQKRNTSTIPSVTMNIDGDHLRPETVRQYATQMMDAAFGAEIEAFLAAFLLQELKQSGEIADELIQEFREMRGVTTLWTEEEGDRT